MSTSDSPQITYIEVEPHKVSLTLDDILLTPLQQLTANLTQGQAAASLDPEVAQHLQTFADLVAQLKDVYSKINHINPTLFRSNQGPPA